MLKDMTLEQLEVLSHSDIAELILRESASLNTPTLFKKICDLLGYSESEYMDKIGDFYTSLATDKRFVFLDTNEWALREQHPVDIVMDDEDLDQSYDEEESENLETEEEDVEESLDEIDEDLEDLEDLSIKTEDEIEEND